MEHDKTPCPAAMLRFVSRNGYEATEFIVFSSTLNNRMLTDW
jgi:hypothetical protein